MRHFKDPEFQPLYDALPENVQRLADRASPCWSRRRARRSRPSARSRRIADSPQSYTGH